MAALSVVFLAIRPTQVPLLAVAGVTGAAAIYLGVRRYRPARAWPWYCLAGALLLSAVVRIIVRLLPGQFGTYRPGSLAVYLIALVMSVLMIGGIVGLARATARDFTAAMDVAILLLGAGLLVGVLLAVPYAVTPDIPAVQAVFRTVFVARDVVLLAAVLHLATSQRWTSPITLLVTGVAGFLTYDAVLRFGLIRGAVLEGTAIELGWLLLAAAWGGAALLPAMANLGAPSAVPGRRSVPLRLGLMTVASVLPFTLLLLSVYQADRPWYEPLVATGAATMLVLVLVQLVGLAVQLRQQSEGERMLRQAVTEMAAAGEGGTVTEVLVAAVPRLVPARADGVVAAVAEEPGAAGPHHPGIPESVLVRVANLPGPVARRLRGAEALAYPLCSGSSIGTPGPLTLYVSGGQSLLAKLRPRLDVLSSQACLVLDRIRLNREVVQRATEEYVRALAQTSGDIILIVDDDNRVTLASPPASELFGRSRLAGAWLPELVDEAQRPAVVDLLRRTRAGETLLPERGRAVGAHVRPGVVEPATSELGDEGVNVAEWSVRRADGSVTTVEVACRRVKAADPAVHGLVVDLRDVTEQRRLEAEVAARATRDSLTGLLSRQVFRDRLSQALEENAGQNMCIGVIFLDLDGFRLINNHFGYEAGDTVLATVADRLTTSMPTGATVARAGGDEFAALLEAADPAAVHRTAARLLSAVARPIEVLDNVITCTASAGVATTTGPNTAAELSRQAEVALLAAQAEGSGQTHHYDPVVHGRVLDRLELRSALERALEGDELTLVYQPIVDLTSGRTAGFEALLRWNHPTRGPLSPDAFIGVAEESGVIVAIGDWVLATALSEARRWARVVADEPPYVGVNVSPRQFESSGFFGRVRRRLAETGIPASRLHLEITEHVLLRDDDATWNELQRLRSLEVQIAIDDFGTGYSALSYLGRVPLDIVKLDRSFAHAITTTPQQRELVEGIIKLTEILKLSVVAEGIETDEQRAVMKSVGCQYGQGYLFARPMPAEAVLAWLNDERDRTRAVAVSGVNAASTTRST